MVAANDDRGFDNAPGDKLVKLEARFDTFAIAEPANASRETLEGHLLAGHFEPAVEMFIFREEFHHGFVCAIDILGVAGEGYPAEGTFAIAKQRADIGRDKAGEIKGILNTIIKGALAEVVAVIKHLSAAALEFQHSFDVASH